MEEKLLTSVEAAAALGISKRRVIKLIEEKRLPAQRYGVQFLIKESDLELVRERKTGRPKKGVEETIKIEKPKSVFTDEELKILEEIQKKYEE